MHTHKRTHTGTTTTRTHNTPINVALSFKGIVKSRANADFTNIATNVHLSLTPWTICI